MLTDKLPGSIRLFSGSVLGGSIIPSSKWLQGGPLQVINRVITPINGLING